ncbi:MAG: PhoU domain-containing protein, partial [Candidatus Kariarchaeaceae archaeon]
VAMNDNELAQKVLDMEEELDEIIQNMFRHTALSIRSHKDADDLNLYFHLGSAINTISDASANIAELVTENINSFIGHDDLIDALHDTVDAIPIDQSSKFFNKTEKELDLKEKLGVDIMALKRGDDIIFGADEIFVDNDVLYLRGANPSIEIVKQFNIGQIPDIKSARKELINYKPVKSKVKLPVLEKRLVRIINNTNLMIDLALIYQVESNEVYLKTLDNFENIQDSLLLAFYNDLLEAYKIDEISKSRAFAYHTIGSEMEIISDAVFFLASRKKGKNPWRGTMIKKMIEESMEQIETIKIESDSPYLNKSVWDAEVEIKFSGEVFDVIAIRRKKKLIPYPDETEKLEIGDILIVKTYNPDSEIEESE